jgi:lipopolysaccharide transport system permease protein
MSIASLSREAWQFRDFISASVRREFVSRYQGTQFGFFWSIAHPLALIVIYTLVFSEVMRPNMPGHASRFAYSIYVTAGLITWTLFSDLLTRSVSVFVHNGSLMKRVNIPSIAFPVIATTSVLVHFAIVLVLFVGFLIVSGNLPGVVLLGIVPVLAVTVLLAIGLGVLLGTVNVFYRDVEQSTSIVLQFWFWLTPVVYPAEAVPAVLRSVLAWNPLWPIVRAMQGIFLDHRFPDWTTLILPLVVALAFIALARAAFNRLAHELVDEL